MKKNLRKQLKRIARQNLAVGIIAAGLLVSSSADLRANQSAVISGSGISNVKTELRSEKFLFSDQNPHGNLYREELDRWTLALNNESVAGSRAGMKKGSYTTWVPDFEEKKPKTTQSTISGDKNGNETRGNFYVINTDDSGSGSLRQAINDANSNPGHDYITFNIPEGSEISLTTIAGNNTALQITDEVTINGDLGNGSVVTVKGTGSKSKGMMRILSVDPGENKTVNIKNINLQDGFENSDNPDGFGAGILVLSGTTNLNTVEISGCTARAGGGISNGNLNTYEVGELNLENCTISGNTAINVIGGGGILASGNTNINNSYIINNYSTVGRGGGLATNVNHGNEDFNIEITNTTITGNESDATGGGVSCFGGDISITGCTINNNSSGYMGGGIGLEHGSLTINNATIQGNSAPGIGGGMLIYYNSACFGTLSFTGTSPTTISGNTAGFGSGIAIIPFLYNPPINLNSSTLNINDNVEMYAFEPIVLNIDAGTSTVVMGNDGDQTMGQFKFYNLAIQGSGTKTITGPVNLENNLTINTGNTLAIDTDASLTMADGASLIDNGTLSNSGTLKMLKTITGNAWHLISVPFSGYTANFFLNHYLQGWSEAGGNWTDIINPETPLNTKTGYALWENSGKDQEFEFTGTPLTGNQSAGITHNGTSGNFIGANLLGNPYPSSIDWEQVSGHGAVYYWDGNAYVAWPAGTGSYGTGSRYIPPFQGFFIIADANGNFNFTNAMRTHEGANGFYKEENTTKLSDGLMLFASNGSYKDKLLIRFDENAQPGFQKETDAWKLPSNTQGISQLWSVCMDGNLSIDVRAEQETIQLGFANNQAGIYSIGIEDIADIPEAWLEDTKTGAIHDLTKSDYEFTWTPETDSENRFKLHFKAVGIQENTIRESNILIYAANRQIFVKGADAGQVKVCDMMGRIVLEQEITSSEAFSIPVNLQKGVYVVTVQSGDEIKTEKIFIY